ASRFLDKFIEQRPRVLQIGKIEALVEPVINVAEHCPCFIAAVGIAQQARETHRGAQLPPLGFLLTRDFERGPKTVLWFRRCSVATHKQRLAFKAEDLGEVDSFTGTLTMLQRFVQDLKPLFCPSRPGVGVSEHRIRILLKWSATNLAQAS